MPPQCSLILVQSLLTAIFCTIAVIQYPELSITSQNAKLGKRI